MKRRWKRNEAVQGLGLEDWVGSGLEDAREAKEKVQRLSMDRFHWLSKEDGIPEDYLITGVEECRA